MWPQFPGKVRILCIVRWQWHSYSQIYGDKVLWFIRPGLDTLININMPRNLHVLIADWLFRITPIFLEFFFVAFLCDIISSVQFYHLLSDQFSLLHWIPMWVTKLKYLLYSFLHTQKWVLWKFWSNFRSISRVCRRWINSHCGFSWLTLTNWLILQ